MTARLFHMYGRRRTGFNPFLPGSPGGPAWSGWGGAIAAALVRFKSWVRWSIAGDREAQGRGAGKQP